MVPTMDTTVRNIQLLSPESYKKASFFIENLLSADKIKNNHKAKGIFRSEVCLLFLDRNYRSVIK